MTNTEYNKLLKYLYFEGYANSYEEADYILEDMSNIERKQLMMEAGIYEKLTPERRKQYKRGLAVRQSNQETVGKGRPRKRATPPQPGAQYYRKGMTQTHRDTMRDAAREENPERPEGRGSLPKGKKLARQRATGVSENYELLLDYLIDEGYTNTVDGALTIIENMSDDWMESILDEELTGERRKRALKKGFKHLATAKEGSSVTKNRDSNLPTRRSGYGSSGGPRYKRGNTPGLAKVKVTGERESDRGSGNKANRRAGKKVKDNEDRYYWNDTDPDF